jgi:drug/metabolite transporter (DMT)-like permease
MSGFTVLPALGSALFFGLALVLTQFGLRDVSPIRGACVSVPTTALIFLALSPVTVGFGDWRGAGVIVFAIAGCLFPAAVTLLTFEANRRIGPNLTGALGNLTPIFAVAIAVVTLGEAPTAWQIVGIGVICVGATTLLGGSRPGPRIVHAWMIALPLAAALVRGMVQPLVKVGLESWPNPFAAATIGYLVSALVVLGAGAIVTRGNPVTFDRRGHSWFVAVGGCNGLAVLGLYAALAQGPVTVVAPVVATYPLATLLFSRMLLGSTELTARMIGGIAVTVAGVAILLMV